MGSPTGGITLCDALSHAPGVQAAAFHIGMGRIGE